MEEQVVISPQAGKQEIALNLDADVIFFGGAAGSAKSYTELMRFLRHCEDPNFKAIYFRRTTVQLSGAGGLWQTAKDMFSPFGIRIKEKEMITQFPSKASAKFSHMEHEKNKIDHQGLQYSAIFWDELTHFTETQFIYLLSRLRSEAEGSSYTFATMNPDPDSWVLKWVEWYLDEEGFPDPEKDGRIRYFITIEGEPVFAATREELIEQYPANCHIKNPRTGKMVLIPPKSFVFLSGTIFDNPALIDKNPNYLAELQNLPEIERARLLHGNWYARPEGSNYWQRDWVKNQKPPISSASVRAYDKAGSEPSDVYKYPDYTASIKLSKDRDGFYYIQGSFNPLFKDDEVEVLGRFRKRAGARDALILAQAKQDGSDIKIVLPQDPGSAGKTEFQESAKKLITEGFIVKQDPMPTQKSKLKRFEPFASASENGLVFIDESSFPNKKTLEAFYKELESFDGERSTGTRKDDWADAIATAFNFLAKQVIILPLKLPEGSSSKKHELLSKN